MGWPPVDGRRCSVEGAQPMAHASRDRVGVDLRGIGDAVRAVARAREITLAAFAREALIQAVGPRSTPPIELASTPDPCEIVKLTLRLPSGDAERLVLKSAALGLSYGAFVARLVRGSPLPALSAERAADRAALIASVDHLAQLSADLNALIRMLRRADSEGAERYRAAAESLVSDVRRHLDLASKVIARNGAES
jgi:hypothetical protein